MSFVTVNEAALSPHQRDALGKATLEWKRMPTPLARVAQDLERCGLVETEVRWQWSRTDPGAGSHVTMWRRRHVR